MRNSVYRQKDNCIALLNKSNAPLTIQINSVACAIEFRHYAKEVNFEPEAFEIAFEDINEVEVNLQDFIVWYLTYSEEALEVEEQYQEQLSDLRGLQNKCAYEILMMFVASYVVFEDDNFIEGFESEEEADEYIKSSKYGSDYSKHRVIPHSVEFAIGEFGEGDDIDVTIDAEIDGELNQVAFNVQTVNGLHMSQMGCWITTNGGDGEFSLTENMIFEALNVVEVAENWYAETVKAGWQYHDAGFNASINSQSVSIKEMDGEFITAVVNDDFNANDYNVPETLGEAFDSLEQAQEYLDQFKTGDYQDVQGVAEAIRNIKRHA